MTVILITVSVFFYVSGIAVMAVMVEGPEDRRGWLLAVFWWIPIIWWALASGIIADVKRIRRAYKG